MKKNKQQGKKEGGDYGTKKGKLKKSNAQISGLQITLGCLSILESWGSIFSLLCIAARGTQI